MNEAMKREKAGWGRLSPVDRYYNDAQFHVLVDTLYAQIEQANYTPSELREACHLAACRYEWRHIRPMLIDPREPFKWNVKPAEGL